MRLYLEHDGPEEVDRRLENSDDVLFVSVRNGTVPAHEYRSENRWMNVRSVQRKIERYCRRIGIPEEQLHPHRWRRCARRQAICWFGSGVRVEYARHSREFIAPHEFYERQLQLKLF
ncbi:hypothetical protein ACN22W_09440 [Burkholderia theae]|uniref:hypothetical protein n=1 Tax=Burkholderia theae TaxID=3143496 RepID=UPI003AFA38D8